MLRQNLVRKAQRAGSGMRAVGLRLQEAVRPTEQKQWRHHDEIALRAIPGCLRGGDPFTGEALANGLLRYGANTLDLNQDKPFSALANAHAITAYIDRFTWLADLKALGDPAAATIARRLLLEWRRERQSRSGATDSSIRTITFRLRACLANGDLLLNDCAVATFDQFNDIVASDIGKLEALATRPTTPLSARVSALLALVLAGLVVEGCEDLLAAHEAELLAALDEAVLEDGSAKSRSRDEIIDLLLDLIPVIRMYSYAERDTPQALVETRKRASQFLKTLHISGAQFAGFGRIEDTTNLSIARVLKLETHAAPMTHASDAGVIRCERGRLTVFADYGGSGATASTPDATSSVGALEIAFAHRPVITTRLMAKTRTSSARHRYSELTLASLDLEASPEPVTPIRGQLTTFDMEPAANAFTLEHDRFLESHGLRHRRAFSVTADDETVTAREQLFAEAGHVRFARDVPLAIFFELAPEISPKITDRAGEIELRLPEGITLVFFSECGQVSLETQTDAAPDGTQRRSLRIALRKTTYGEADLTWSLGFRSETDS